MALQEYKRSTDEKRLVQDSNVEVYTVFYPPYFESESSLDLGDSDPNKVGAIATFKDGDSTVLAVYQGGGVWKSISTIDELKKALEAPLSSLIWSKTNEGTMEHNNDGSSLAILGDKLFILGSWDDGATPKTSSSVYRYNDDLSATTRLSDAPWEGRHTFGCAYRGNEVVVFGGDFQLGHYQKDAWKGVLQPDNTIAWTEINNNLPWGDRVLFGSVYHNGSLFVIGGQDSSFSASGDNLDDVWRSDDFGLTWTQIAVGLPQFAKNMYGTCVSFNGYIYCISGGVYDSVQQYSSEVWRSVDGIVWEQMLDIPFPGRQYPSVNVYQGHIILFGGSNIDYSPSTPSGNLNDCWAMDVDGNWTELKTGVKPTVRHAHATAVYRDMLVVSTGNFYTENNTWVLSPSKNPVVQDSDGIVNVPYIKINTDYEGALIIDKQTDGLFSYLDYYNKGIPIGAIGVSEEGNIFIKVVEDNKDLIFQRGMNGYRVFHEGDGVSLGEWKTGSTSIYSTPTDGAMIIGAPGSNTVFNVVHPNGQTIYDVPSSGLDTRYYGKISAVGFKVNELNTPPASSTSVGTKGEIRITEDYIYVCIDTNTWVRSALTTW